MEKQVIITIGRQFGSGGREIGRKIAKKLDVPFYDKELLARAAKESGLCQELFETFDERPRSLLYSIVTDSYAMGLGAINFDEAPEQKVMNAATQTIKNIAQEGSCVIVGRCADFILSKEENCFNVFIYAPLENRIDRVKEYDNIDAQKAKKIITQADKKRASYYNFYTTKTWGAVDSYDVCIDSTFLGIDATVDLICDLVKKKFEQ